MSKDQADAQANYIIDEQAVRERAKADGITHLSTGIAVLRDGKILAVRRAADDFLGGSYELPGGGVDDDETLPQSVARELIEETGLTLGRIVGVFDGFEYSTPKKPKVRQLNFLVEADGEVVLSEEHDAADWVDQSNLSNLDMTDSMHDCFVAAFNELDRLRLGDN